MLVSGIFAFAHHVAAFAMVAALVAQMVLINGELTLASARRLQRLDGLYGGSATLLLIIGLHRVFLFEKGAEYYGGSAFFWAKMGLFAFVALASAIPTIEFFRWGKALKQNQVPAVTAERIRTLRMIMHAELAAVVLILLCAAMMARGVELF